MGGLMLMPVPTLLPASAVPWNPLALPDLALKDERVYGPWPAPPALPSLEPLRGLFVPLLKAACVVTRPEELPERAAKLPV